VAFKNFVSPHVHIQSLDSASTPEAFAEREVQLQTGALVVTDHGTLVACPKVFELAKDKDIVKKNGGKPLTPILGLEGYFRDDDCPIIAANGVKKNADGKYVDYLKYCHFTTHFIDQSAFKTGIKLLSRAPIERHGAETKPLFDWEDMEELAASNVTITTGCLIGMVQRHLLQNNDPEMAKKYFDRMRGIVPKGNLYVEIFPHVCSHNWVEGVFITVQEEGAKEPVKLRWYAGKNLKTNVGEVKAGELAQAWKKKDHGKHEYLLGVKDFRVWTERTPAKILTVEHIEDFIQNECRPWCPDGDVQLGANKFVLELAKRYDVPVLISDDSHYATPDEKIVQDVRLAQSGSWRFYGSYHRQSSDEAFQYFRDKMGVDERTFEEWIDNSYAWASRFKDFKMESKPSLPKKFYEERYAEVGAKNSLEYTMHLIKEHGRMNWKDPKMVNRLNEEIRLLHLNGHIDLLPYFFIDEEVCRYYRDQGMLTGPGRGSAAGLLLTYLLGITHVNPLRYNLSLDRFLTLDRIKSGKLPDIDQDLPTREPLVGEDEKSGWLYQRFGNHVAQISTVMTLKLSSAVLDVARFKLGKVPPEIAILSKKFERPPQGLDDHKFVFGYEDSGSWVPGSITFDPALQEYIEKYPDHWEVVQKCLGLGRGLSRHACGFVIADCPIEEFIPMTEVGGVPCTQFTATAVEAMGGLKMDFLVINSLNDIANAIKMVHQRSGLEIPKPGIILDGKFVPWIRLVPKPGFKELLRLAKEQGTTPRHEDMFVDIWDLPEDQGVFADVACGRTESCFQFNTPGAVQWLRHFAYKKPNGNYAIDSIEGMSAFTALDRPGPLKAFVRHPEVEDSKHNMLVEYARRARGAKPSPDILPVFDTLFPETHGVMVYQEQLQRLYQEVTGCSGAEAEAFRGDVAKKKKEKIIAAYAPFIEGATKSMGSKADAEAVWQFIQSWAAYGFNKSHSVCYSIIGYACAYLKHHYPLEWWCAVLQNAKKEEISEKFWRYCGHLIDLPDVTRPYPNFTLVGDRIQAPLSLLHGVGEAAHAELMESAPYTSIDDVVRKREAKKESGTKVVEKVVKNENGTETVEKKTVKGRSALHDGIIYKLIISGAMDNLFPRDWETVQMLEEFQAAIWRLENEKSMAAGKKRLKLAPKPVKNEFININQFSRYQLRKDILPAYSEPLLKYLIERKHENVFNDGRRWNYYWKRNIPFATEHDLERIEASSHVPENGFRVAVVAFVEDVRVFTWGPKDESGRRLESKEAVEVVLDINGLCKKFVRWPNNDTGELDDDFKEMIKAGLKGAIVIVVLSKFRVSKPFSIDHIEIVQPPLGIKTEEETTP
jgi:DNA polymerase III alpha subunit